MREKEIIKGLRDKDPIVYKEIFSEYFSSLVLFVERHIGDRETAKDVVQDVFFKLYEISGTLKDNFNLKSWLFTTARNASIDYLRHLKVADKNKLLMAEAMLYSNEVDKNVDEVLFKKINMALDSLPEQCKLIIQKSIFEGKKYLEIADELNISINTIRTQVSRGYRKLRELLSTEDLILFFLLSRDTGECCTTNFF